jgi:hypothetical protein
MVSKPNVDEVSAAVIAVPGRRGRQTENFVPNSHISRHSILTDLPKVMGLCYGVTLKLIVSLAVNIFCISFILNFDVNKFRA